MDSHRAIERRTRPMLGFTDFSLHSHPSLRYRTDAHDQERANDKRRQGTNPRTAFLLPGSISSWTISALDRSNILIATEPPDAATNWPVAAVAPIFKLRYCRKNSSEHKIIYRFCRILYAP